MRTISGSQHSLSVVRYMVLPLFLVSGTVGLVYKVVWTRIFGDVFGNTVFSMSTVLTAFMLGLAIGSWLLGRIADRIARPLKLYALLELAIGAYALAFPSILAATDIFYGWLYRSFHPGFYPPSNTHISSNSSLVMPRHGTTWASAAPGWRSSSRPFPRSIKRLIMIRK